MTQYTNYMCSLINQSCLVVLLGLMNTFMELGYRLYMALGYRIYAICPNAIEY